jgi:3-dehydroquinate synthase
MHRIRIKTPQGSSLLFMNRDAKEVTSLLPAEGIFIITDTNVRRYYSDIFPGGEVLETEPGEKTKRLETVGTLCSKLLDAGADRSSFILGFGGGVVCDIAGLVASIYMRGVRHGFVSTTLLSQVDASIGGKTGVNLGEYKNIIGTFRQPEFVLCDHRLLSTLPEEEFLSGIGEMIKHAVIRDRNLFFDISTSIERIDERDPDILAPLIERAVRIKAAVVRHDPEEKGPRRILNFGHTFGHVLETCYGIPHGLAVAEGMLVAAEMSVWTGDMPHSELKMLDGVMDKAGMMQEHELPTNIISLIARDKKSESGMINMVLLRSVGRAITRKMKLADIADFVKYYRDSNRRVNKG